MNAHVDRQLRLALHAFPTRWRTERGDELVATATDMLAPDAEHVPLSVLADIVRAGWGERLRRHPPLGRWLRYCGGGKLPHRWHAWVNDDLDGRWYWLRAGLRRYVMLAGAWWAMFGILTATQGPSSSSHWSGLVGFGVVFPLSRALVGRFRRQVRKQHGLTTPGGLLPPPAVVWVPAMGPSLPVASTAATLAAGASILGALALWRSTHASADLADAALPATAAYVAVGIALVLGVVLAHALRARAGERLELLPHRPALSSRQRAVRLAGGTVAAVGGAAYVWFAGGAGSIGFIGALLGTASCTVAVISAGLAQYARRTALTVADLIASPEQLAYLRRQGASVAG